MNIIYRCSALLLFFFFSENSFGQFNCKRLTTGEQSLALSANISEEILQMIRQETDSVFQQLTTTTYELNPSNNSLARQYIPLKGIVFGADAESSYNIVLKLKDRLLVLGHLIFIFDKDKVNNKYKIAVIQSNDQFDILRTVQTKGENYNISTSSIIEKLSAWNKSYPFQIIGANSEWIEAVFVTKPDQMEQFANDVYEFCPDVVDSGSGSVKFLANEMKDTGILYLWWR